MWYALLVILFSSGDTQFALNSHPYFDEKTCYQSIELAIPMIVPEDTGVKATCLFVPESYGL